MSSQTLSEQQALERLARKYERDLRFLRHSPREQRWLPFVEDSQAAPELRDAVIGLIAFAGLVAALVTAPWWLA